jgi:dUTP pyrophosphatase
MEIKILKVREVNTPSRGTDESAGLDFYLPAGETLVIPPHQKVLVPSGIKVSIPKNHALIAFNKSGVAAKKGVIVGSCVVDSDYQGEIHLQLINTTNDVQLFYPNEKVTQFILLPIVLANPVIVNSESDLWLKDSQRGSGGFGSTGTF